MTSSKPDHLRALTATTAVSLILSTAAVRAERVYLEDSNTRRPVDGAATPIDVHDFPRVLNHELIGNISNAEAGKYHFIDAHGNEFPSIESVQKDFSPETMALRHISGRAYQQYNYRDDCVISGGPAFASTTASSQGGPSTVGCGIYAGHWLYEAGTTLQQGINSTATTLTVADASRFSTGKYIVIYNAPAGSFNNAEHAKITSVNKSANTITVQRGYKSTKSSHNAGSIVAQHVLGNGSDPRLWAFNMSSKSPKDASGKTFPVFYSDWIAANLNRYGNGKVTGANVHGVLLDADYPFDSRDTDTNNDLTTDNGLSTSGVNWLSEGLEIFYSRLRQKLPGKYLIMGVHDSRGFGAGQGAQMENWLDLGNGDYTPNPKYKRLDELFQTYLFNMSERSEGPALVHNLTKTPTKQYPGSSSPAPTSNAPFRLALAMSLMEDGYFGTHTALETDAWWDEYAVNAQTESDDFGKAIAKGNLAQIAQHRGWLGKPLGPFKRVYDDAAFAPSNSVIANETFDSNINSWRGSNLTISRVTSNTQDGSGALLASRMTQYNKSVTGAAVKTEQISITGGATYTLAFSARTDQYRQIRVSFGSDFDFIPVGPNWRRYVVELKPSKNATDALKFFLGRENSRVWLDSVYLFKNKSAAVLKREFENGMVLANASSSSKTVQIGAGFRRIKGNQDPAVNDGKSVSSVTLPPYDGLLLVREETAPPPAPSGDGLIGDFIWTDSDGDGLQDADESGWAGATVKLRQCNGNVVATTTSDSNGQYSFTGLGIGDYQVEFVKPNAADFSPYRATGSWSNDSDADPVTGMASCVTIASNTQKRRGIDAGLVPNDDPVDSGDEPGNSSIGDYIWNDLNGDGIQDSNEPGVSGVTINLRECGGLLLGTTQSNSDGSYEFAGLGAGSFMVQWVAPPGSTYTQRRAGSHGAVDSNADDGGFSHCVKLSGTDVRRWIDAGLVF